MTMSARELVLKLWNDASAEGLWAASWQKSLDGLSPEQAAWQPPNAASLHGDTGKRHSIWQIVLHMCLWREHWLRKLAGQTTPKEDLERLNFPFVTDISADAWRQALERFEASQRSIASALKDPKVSDEHFAAIAHFLPHDCYHFGQINYLRAMLGLKPIE